MKNVMFDGYADAYDGWFMQNENVFKSELKLLAVVLGSTEGKRVLSVGCGSGLFEHALKAEGIVVKEGIEPSADMAAIAKKRGMKVAIGTIESAQLDDESYDVIYLNGSSSYIVDLTVAYQRCYQALKPGGRLILIDVPKESAYGLMYLLAAQVDSYDHQSLAGAMPTCPYPLALVKSALWHSSEEKIAVLKTLGMTNFNYMQTLQCNPVYTNATIEEPVAGYQRGGYVAISAEK